jgi:ferredoxin
MHATIQKPIDEIIDAVNEGERVFIVGCDNCAAKCKSGGHPETEAMARRIQSRGREVTGWCVPHPQGMSLCKLSNTKQVLQEEHGEELQGSDVVIVLSCGQGLHAVLDSVGEDKHVVPGCDTIFGGETVAPGLVEEYCSLCGECVVASTGGLCPVTLCSKSLLNGPCGGAQDGKCEVDRERDCGWQLILDRLRRLGRMDRQYREEGVRMKNHAKRTGPRRLTVRESEQEFRYDDRTHTVDTSES